MILHHDDILQNTQRDPVKVATLKSKERELLNNGQRSEYWKDLKNDVITKRLTQKTYRRRLTNYKDIVSRVSDNETTDKIRKSIVQEWLALSTPKNKHLTKNVRYSTTFECAKNDGFQVSDNMPNGLKMSVIQPILTLNLRLSTPLNEVQKDRFSRRVCVVCENDVSMKKSSTKTCCKKCRNQLSNSTHDYTRKIRKEVKLSDIAPPLFDTSDMISEM